MKKRKDMKKRSQVTIFIIIGILLLLMLGIYIIIDTNKHRFVPTEIIPQNVLPVQRYIESCLTNAAKDGLIKMGQQGGFIDIPREILASNGGYINIGSVQKIPLWFYRGESRIPTYDFMRSQLEEHIRKNMDICAQGLKIFREFNIENGTADVEVTFGDSDVSVEMSFPVIVTDKIDNKVTKLRDFSGSIPIRYRRIFDLAQKTYDYEMNTLYLENTTMDIMTSDAEFPFDGMEFKCGSVRWRVNELKQKLQKIIEGNLPRIRIKNTKFAPFMRPEEEYERVAELAKDIRDELNAADYDKVDDPLAEILKRKHIENIPPDVYEYMHFYPDVGANEPNITEKFIYLPNYGMDFAANPSEGGVMSSSQIDTAFKYLRFLCINFYHFTYNIRYPFEVRITDDESLAREGAGYTFRFGMPVNILNNQGIKEAKNTMHFHTEEPPSDFCDVRGDNPATIDVRGIYEGYTDQPLEGVNLTYHCIRYYCSLGQTSSIDGTYKFVGTLPSSCSNPEIIAEKDGYVKNESVMEDNYLLINMEKLQMMPVEFRKKVFFKGGTLTNNYYALEDDEKVVLYFTAKGINYDQYLSYPFVDEANSKLGFIEKGGKYSLNALLIKDDKTIGGYINNDLTITSAMIAGNEKMIITVVEYRPVPSSEEDTGDMMQYIYNGNYLNDTKMEFN